MCQQNGNVVFFLNILDGWYDFFDVCGIGDLICIDGDVQIDVGQYDFVVKVYVIDCVEICYLLFFFFVVVYGFGGLFCIMIFLLICCGGELGGNGGVVCML